MGYGAHTSKLTHTVLSLSARVEENGDQWVANLARLMYRKDGMYSFLAFRSGELVFMSEPFVAADAKDLQQGRMIIVQDILSGSYAIVQFIW